MAIKSAIFKIGGKIFENSKRLINSITQLTQLYENDIIQKIILIPGGGKAASFVREMCLEFKFSNELAHWIAIYSMNFNGIKINKKFPDFEISEEFEDIQKEDKIMEIFLPYRYLRNTDELPHSWDVTSDSITLYLAHKLNLEECFLIKDVDGIIDINQSVIKELSTERLNKLKEQGWLFRYQFVKQDLKSKSAPIDSYIVKLIDEFKIICTILNGASQNLMIYDYFKSDKNVNKKYTKIFPT
ncbi:MAG: hypothetical protein ACFFBH_08450 [Promethearchaeota archaeon]